MKIDRLIAILVILLRKERVQAKELADRFGVSVRTILRDIDAINLAGIPVVTYQGVNGGIGLVEGYRLDKSVLNSDDMAAIISTLKGLSGTLSDSNQHEVLMDKLKNTLTSSQLEMLNSKVNRMVIDLSPWGGYDPQKEKFEIIRGAIENARMIQFSYMNAEGKETSRQVEPYTMVYKGQKWYVYAWCLLRKDFRFFKLSRMKELDVCEDSFIPKKVSLDQLPMENQWYKPEKTVALDLVFIKQLKGIIEEWFSGEMMELETGEIKVHTIIPEDHWLYGFLLSFGTGVEVLHPPHVRSRLAEMAEGIFKKYSQ